MAFDLERAKKISEGLYAVTDSIVEYYETQAQKMFPNAIAEIERLRKENKELGEYITILEREKNTK